MDKNNIQKFLRPDQGGEVFTEYTTEYLIPVFAFGFFTVLMFLVIFL